MTSLLCHPHLIEGEGPQGYCLRLANANGLNVANLKALGVHFGVSLLKSLRCLPDAPSSHPLIAYATDVVRQWEQCPPLWNIGRCRCCPLCLHESAHWRMGWELLFFDACPVHGCWLVDRCDCCGSAITWRRQELLRCDCGHHFARSQASEAPAASVNLATDLQHKLRGRDGDSKILPMQRLSFEQATRLIRLLGTYGQSHVGRLPQKIQNVGAMDVSWQVTSTAAEILSRWPESFEHMLRGMLDRSAETTGQRFPARFGFFYALLYRRFADVEFVELRNAFENFVAEHWRGPIAKRNTRLSQAMLARATWVPASHARRQLQVSASRLAELVQSGALLGEKRLSEAGRRFLVVHKDSLQAMSPALNDEVNLSAVSEMLGLTRARLRSVLPQLFPNAKKIEGNADRWAISRADASRLSHICNGPIIAIVGKDQVSMDQILRFWYCSEFEVGTLLCNVRDQILTPTGRLRGPIGLSRLVFQAAAVRQMIEGQRSVNKDRWTVPQIAEMLNVKQEVAYFLIRGGMLTSSVEIIGRREAAMVDREALDTFRTRYVFARDLARLHKTSSRSLQDRLAEINIHPVVSPSPETCRQLIYEQTPALKELFPAMAQTQ